MAGCVAGSGATGGGNIPPETRFRVLGTPGTPFSAVITDTVASWDIIGVVPMNIVTLKSKPPVRMFAFKLTGNSSLLSINIIFGDNLVELASSNDPFGRVVVQTGRGLSAIAPPADPDLRFFVKGATGQFFDGLIEDLNSGFELGGDAAPTLFLFENPDGRVDGLFTQTGGSAGPLNVDLLIGGRLAATVQGAPSVTLKSP